MAGLAPCMPRNRKNMRSPRRERSFSLGTSDAIVYDSDWISDLREIPGGFRPAASRRLFEGKTLAFLRAIRYFIITIATAFSCSNMVGAAEIESSFPPSNAIDARSPFVGSAAELQGWQSIEIRFSAAISSVDPGDFTLFEKGGDGIPPSIESVARIDSKTVLVILNEPLEPGTWVDLSHVSR